ILMAPAMSTDLKERIIEWYFEGRMTYRQIATLTNCSIGHVSNVISTFRTFGEVNNPYSLRTGRPSLFEETDIHYVSTLLDANPVLYLDEIQARLADVRN
ncbi:hypothetical protein BV22DRAFT_997590, partial [Leucogyrophana mollusca]